MGLENTDEDILFLKIEIDDAIKSLPSVERIVVSLRKANFSQRECGLLLGLTRAAIGYIYKRARKNLKGLITT